MTNLLAIDTAGARCSIGLDLDGNRFLRSEHVERRHNERLLPLLQELLEEAGVSRAVLLARLDAVAFARGPGSFTGGRIAAAAAQALALAGDVPVLRISSSAMLARALLRESDNAEVDGVLTSIRSRRDLYYLAAYENQGTYPVSVRGDQLLDAQPAPELLGPFSDWPLVGERPCWWQGADPVSVVADAGALLDLAAASFAGGEAVDAAAGLPEYLEGDAPWRKSS